MRTPVQRSKSALWLLMLFVVSAFISLPQQTTAQPALTFTRIVNNWPTIELYFKVACDGQPAYPTSKQFYKVYENGIEVGEYTLWCPDPRQRCAISVALVFDASGSMSGGGNAGAKAAGNAFVDLMDGVIDEAAIIWFTSTVNVELGMTTNKTDLHDAVNALPASGMTAVWDGMYVGLQELIQSGSNPCRAVIAMTDGGDNSSSHTPDEIIALANRNRIRVFTIGLGSVTPAQLETIALLTGGKYYQAPSPSQLVTIYEEISTIIFGGFLECLITYQAVCQDGGIRTVDLQLYNYCHGGSDTKTRTYRAPKDTSTYIPLEIELGEGTGRGGTEVTVPLNLVTPIMPKDNFYNSSFTILFDPDCVQFKNIATPPGTLLNGVPISVEPINGGIKVITEDRILIEGNGKLAELTFKLSDPDDTTCCELDLATWVFEAGCFKPVLKDGEICIIPRAPIVSCQLQMPRELTWVRSAKDYSPNPFNTKITVVNTGDKDAKNVRFKIDFDPADFALRSPISDLQPGFPVDVPISGMSEATWNMSAKTRLSGDSVEICITAMMDNHPDVTCCLKMWIPPTEPILDCTIADVTIVANNDMQRYEPMPFNITVNVLNRGGMKSDTVFATIIVPADLQLAGSDAPDQNTKKVVPAFLLPNQSGSVGWQLTHPITLQQKEYIVQVWVKTSNADSSLCEVRITIPPLDAPSIRASCNVPDELVFDENLGTTGEYSPNPFNITLTAVNLGKMSADNVTGFLYLPENVEFAPPGQDPTFSFGTLDAWNAGDPVPQKTWTVRWTKRFRYNSVAGFKWAVGGVGRTGIPTDSVYAYCETDIPGLKPSFACTITAPARIGLNAAETGNEPNPFDVVYTIENTSKQVASITQLVCYYPNDGISLRPTPPENTQTRVGNWELQPGDIETFTWTFDVAGRITLRNLNIQVVAFDDEGNPISCEQRIIIDPLKTALTCDLQSSELIIDYDQIIQDYTNKTLVATATLFNAGGFNLSNISAEIVEVYNPDGYIEFDPAFADNSNPKTRAVLFQGTSHQFEWGYHLAKPNTTGVMQVVELSVTYFSNETPLIEGACNVIIQIEPVLTPSLVCELRAPDSIKFVTDHYEPDIFDVLLKVTNVGNGDAQNVKAYVLQDERFTVIAGSSIRDLPSMPPAFVVDFGDNDGFQVKVKPRATDGYDTIRVVVVADGIPAAHCEYIIWVQAEKRPVFDMVCTPDSRLPMQFDEGLNDYVPNPFEVTTTITNIGAALAKNCEVVFVGPRKFSPVNQNSVQAFTTLNQELDVDSSWSFTWDMEALRQEVATTENMIFQVRGKGGLTNDIVIAECQVPIMIPPARAAKYDMVCTSPAALTYDASSSSYTPDPFQFTVKVTNNGQAEGRGIKVLPDFPSRLYWAGSVVHEQYIPSLQVGKDTTLTWLLRPTAETFETLAKINACLVDTFNTTACCASTTLIPPATEPSLSLFCEPEFAALTVDAQIGDYLPRNPFKVYLTITNNSPSPIYDVVAVLTSQSSDLIPIAPTTQQVAAVLQPGQSIGPLEWEVRAKPRTQSGDVTMCFRVTSSNVAARVCCFDIYVPEIGRPSLDCNITRKIIGGGDDDFVLNFLTTTGDYEGEDSGEGFTFFTLTVNVMNVGEAMADQVRVRITALDGGATLHNDYPTKPLDEGDALVVNDVGHASWRYKPIRKPDDQVCRFEVTVTSSNAEISTCIYEMTIEGAPKVVDVTLPEDAVGQFGDKIAVPIYISPTIGRDVNIYKLNVKFDPSVVRYVAATNAGTQTQFGWNSPRATLFTVDGSAEPNLVRVQDFTTGSPLSSKTDGILAYLLFEAVYGGEDATKLDFATADLEFVLEFSDGGQVYRSSMNSVDDAANGDITLNLLDGLVTVSGSCIVPLNSSLKFQLAQNKPNPFNPSTVIEYTVGIDSRVKIDIYDAVGRYVKTLVDEHQKAGHYRRTFNASGLPSGTYLYKLESPHYTETKRMVLTR